MTIDIYLKYQVVIEKLVARDLLSQRAPKTRKKFVSRGTAGLLEAKDDWAGSENQASLRFLT
jgi:hypothetical protein